MSASISIFLRAERMKSNGEIPMYLRFTLNRKKVDISLKKYVSPKTSIPIQKLEKLKPSERLEYYAWNTEKEQLTKGADIYDKINYFITKEKRELLTLF